VPSRSLLRREIAAEMIARSPRDPQVTEGMSPHRHDRAGSAARAAHVRGAAGDPRRPHPAAITCACNLSRLTPRRSSSQTPLAGVACTHAWRRSAPNIPTGLVTAQPKRGSGVARAGRPSRLPSAPCAPRVRQTRGTFRVSSVCFGGDPGGTPMAAFHVDGTGLAACAHGRM
jgi:hypothetical protein